MNIAINDSFKVPKLSSYPTENSLNTTNTTTTTFTNNLSVGFGHTTQATAAIENRGNASGGGYTPNDNFSFLLASNALTNKSFFTSNSSMMAIQSLQISTRKQEGGGNIDSSKGFGDISKWIKLISRVVRFKDNLIKIMRRKALEYKPYGMEKDPEVRVIENRNEVLLKKREFRLKDIIDYQESDEKSILDDYTTENFDFSLYKSDFHPKDLNIPSNADIPSLGKVTKAGIIYKFKSNSTSYHSRWLVLRGFNLYWYRKPDDQRAKGIIPLPDIPLPEYNIDGHKRCFAMEEAMVRKLIFLNDFVGQSWKMLIGNQIAYRYYLDQMLSKNKKLSQGLIRYFNDHGATTLDLCDLCYRDQKIYDLLYETFTLHHKLKQILFARTKLNNANLQKLIKSLLKEKKCNIEELILDDNSLNRESISDISSYLNSDISSNLRILTLNNNNISDLGVQALIDSLRIRFDKLNSTKKKNDYIIMPLITLGLSNVKMSDQGLFAIVTFCDHVHKLASNHCEYPVDSELLCLDVSSNMVSDNGVKALAKVFGYFHGIKELNISNLTKLEGSGFKTLMKSLKTNYSLQSLNYSNNILDDECIGMLLQTLEDNYVLKRIFLTFTSVHYSVLVSKYERVMKYFNIA